MAAKTGAERVQALRQRREAQGLVRMEVYVHPDDAEAVRSYVKRKNKARVKSGDFTSMSDAIYGTFAKSED